MATFRSGMYTPSLRGAYYGGKWLSEKMILHGRDIPAKVRFSYRWLGPTNSAKDINRNFNGLVEQMFQSNSFSQFKEWYTNIAGVFETSLEMLQNTPDKKEVLVKNYLTVLDRVQGMLPTQFQESLGEISNKLPAEPEISPAHHLMKTLGVFMGAFGGVSLANGLIPPAREDNGLGRMISELPDLNIPTIPEMTQKLGAAARHPPSPPPTAPKRKRKEEEKEGSLDKITTETPDGIPTGDNQKAEFWVTPVDMPNKEKYPSNVPQSKRKKKKKEDGKLV